MSRYDFADRYKLFVKQVRPLGGGGGEGEHQVNYKTLTRGYWDPKRGKRDFEVIKTELVGADMVILSLSGRQEKTFFKKMEKGNFHSGKLFFIFIILNFFELKVQRRCCQKRHEKGFLLNRWVMLFW